MNKDIIHKAIEHPEVALNAGVEDLEKISSQYPYFGAAQLLLTKAYQRTNHYRYTDQLHQAAIYSTDRKHLYEWVKKPLAEETRFEANAPAMPHVATPVQTEEEPQEIITQTEPIVTQAPTPAEEPEVVPALQPRVSDLVSLMLEDELPAHKVTTPAPVAEKAPSVTAEKEAPVSTPPSPVEQAKPTEETQSPAAVDATPAQTATPESHLHTEQESEETEEVPTISIQQFDPVETEILLEAMQSSIELEVSEEAEESKSPVSADEPAIVTQNTRHTRAEAEPTHEEEEEADSYAAWIYKRSQEVHFSTTDKPALPQDEPQAVSDWVRTPQPQAASNLEDEEKDETEPAMEEAEYDEMPPVSKSPLSHGIKKLTPSATKSHQQELIDRFIKFEPKITPGKALEYSAGNLAKESLEEDFSFVTETMAILFAKQGKPDKARKAFKKLMELHPEKSVYFAAQLKNLDKYKK